MTPRDQFKKFLPDNAAKLREEVQKGWLLTSLTFAQAQVVDGGATADQIEGMNRLISSLKQLAMDTPEVVKLPEKKLQVLDRPAPANQDVPTPAKTK